MLWRRASLSVLRCATCSTGATGQIGALHGVHTSAASLDPRDDSHDENGQRITIPWVRTVISGVGIMRNPRYNKVLYRRKPACVRSLPPITSLNELQQVLLQVSDALN